MELWARCEAVSSPSRGQTKGTRGGESLDAGGRPSGAVPRSLSRLSGVPGRRASLRRARALRSPSWPAPSASPLRRSPGRAFAPTPGSSWRDGGASGGVCGDLAGFPWSLWGGSITPFLISAVVFPRGLWWTDDQRSVAFGALRHGPGELPPAARGRAPCLRKRGPALPAELEVGRALLVAGRAAAFLALERRGANAFVLGLDDLGSRQVSRVQHANLRPQRERQLTERALELPIAHEHGDPGALEPIGEQLSVREVVRQIKRSHPRRVTPGRGRRRSIPSPRRPGPLFGTIRSPRCSRRAAVAGGLLCRASRARPLAARGARRRTSGASRRAARRAPPGTLGTACA